MQFTMSFDTYMKWKLDYSLFVLHTQFFLDDLEFQVNQENILKPDLNYTEGCLSPY